MNTLINQIQQYIANNQLQKAQQVTAQLIEKTPENLYLHKLLASRKFMKQRVHHGWLRNNLTTHRSHFLAPGPNCRIMSYLTENHLLRVVFSVFFKFLAFLVPKACIISCHLHTLTLVLGVLRIWVLVEFPVLRVWSGSCLVAEWYVDKEGTKWQPASEWPRYR